MTQWRLLRSLLVPTLLFSISLPVAGDSGKVFSFGPVSPGDDLENSDVQKLPTSNSSSSNRSGPSRLESPTTLTPNPNATLSFGKRHPSWSEQDVKDFFNTLQAVMKEGGGFLRAMGWKGVWHRGSRSFNPLTAVRMEYRTKSEFSHSEQTKNRDDVVELYFWRYKSPEDARRNLHAIFDVQKKIKEQSNKYASYRFLGLQRLSLADESYQTAMEARSKGSRKISKVTKGHYLRRGVWVVAVIDSPFKYQTGETILAALNHGFNRARGNQPPERGKRSRDSLEDLMPDTDRTKPPKTVDPF